MHITVEPLRVQDAEAIVAAEDEQTVRWLSGGVSTLERTRDYIRGLAVRAAAGSTKRAFGIWVDGTCVGTVDYDADPQDGIEPGDVNIAYGVAPAMRGHGVAPAAVELLLEIIASRGVGTRAVIRCDPRNEASARVARKAGFTWTRTISSTTEVTGGGESTTLEVFVRPLLLG